MKIMFRSASKHLARHMLEFSSTTCLMSHSTCIQATLLNSKLRATCPPRYYCNDPPKKPPKQVVKHDERTQLHLSIVNDPRLTPRVKHLMVTALMAKVKFIDDELGRLVYADPFGKDVLQFIKTRKRIPMLGIPMSCVLAFFLPVSVTIQVSVGLLLSVISMLDFYRVMRGMSKRIFFIYYEPQHDMFTAMTLSGIQDFDSVHFKEEDFQPDVLGGFNKVLLHGKNYSVFRGKDAYLNELIFEQLWKIKHDTEEKDQKEKSEMEQNISKFK